MTLNEMQATTRALRDNAVYVVRLYAAEHCPHVPATELGAITSALGAISIDEAFDVLDRIEAEGPA